MCNEQYELTRSPRSETKARWADRKWLGESNCLPERYFPYRQPQFASRFGGAGMRQDPSSSKRIRCNRTAGEKGFCRNSTSGAKTP